ncbi:unnamed protein product [Litomosoides sigmodontis]|uniref:U5 small nuclear ribonucleoprotein 40 kDa protein n=1 Tax=Litomosoides sigmodontis TaxID=42156 RepID=A0A3P6T1M6_LITSI|nr:unnamed protein product [Litomosoides sigmodontis]
MVRSIIHDRMTRHGKNATASAVYSYSERRKDAKESGYGTLHQRLGADSVKEFDCCSITLQPCRDPVISPYGYVFDREAVLEYYLEQKKENARKLKEWEKQCKKEEEEAEREKHLDEELKLKKFKEVEGTPAHPGVKRDADTDWPTTSAGATPSGSRINKRKILDNDRSSNKRLREEISNVAGDKAKEYPSFWIPQLNPTVEEQRVFCPLSGKPLKIKELMPVKFTVLPDDSGNKSLMARKVRYMCPITHDALTNTTRCAYLKTSQSVVTMDCVEKIIKKDMIDPLNGKSMKIDDIIDASIEWVEIVNYKQRRAKELRMADVMQNNDGFKRPSIPLAVVGPKKPRLEVVSGGRPQPIPRTSQLMAPIMLLSGHDGEVYAAKFSPDGSCLASAGFDMIIFLWNVYGECENFSTLKGHAGAVMDLHFSTDASYLFTAATDKTVRVWDMDTGTCVRKFKSHKDIVNSCHPARRGPQLVASGSDDCTVLIHDIRRRDPVATLQNAYQITAVTFNDTAEQVIGGGIDNDIKVWDLRRNELVYVMRGHTDTVTGLSLNPDGTHVLSNAMDCSSKIWDIRPFAPEQRCVKSFAGHQHNFEKNLLKCAWSPDSNRISCGSSDRYVYVWDVSSRRVLYKLPGHQGSVNATDFHPKEPILLSAGSDKKIYLGEIDN